MLGCYVIDYINKKSPDRNYYFYWILHIKPPKLYKESEGARLSSFINDR